MATQPVLDDKLHWYKDAIIYELHIKAFHDSDGDGIGDFQGLLQKLDYLQEMGVTAVWVLPFYPSPLKDDGYDIADYYSINPSYGNIEQFKQLLEEAHKRNLKVITELVVNHTSDQHPWFQRARTAPKGSPERDYYVWTDDPNQWKDVRIIFQDFEASNWTWDPVAQQYYWHRFFHHQPDLNYDNPAVQEEIFKVLDYWCEMGVDGFRLDAIPYLFEREGTNGENLPETHEFLKKLRAHIDSKFPGIVFLAEANMWPEEAASYFGNGDECHMNYHFPVMPRMFMALQMEDRYPITDIFDQTPAIPETCQWAIFLRNHDELTLEMVTDEERDYMYKVYAKDPKAKINLGIRHRLAPLMENDRRKIELMNCLLFSLPGTPVIYYGDEIGMGDNFYLGDRNGVRTPMQWSPDRNAGFSKANPQSLYLPVILDPEYHYESVNVEMQRGNTSSLLWYMKRTINMRKKFKAFGRGDLKFLNVDNPKVLAFTRTYQDETLLIVVNLSKFSQAVDVPLSNFKNYVPVELFSKNAFPTIKDEPYFFTLGPHTYHWFQLQKVASRGDDQTPLPALTINSREEIFSDILFPQLETEILPSYLHKTSWFAAKEKMIYSIKITSTQLIKLQSTEVLFLLAEVTFGSGLPETYFIPVTAISGSYAERLYDTCPQSIIATYDAGGEKGLLCDAVYTIDMQHWLFQQVENAQDDGAISFSNYGNFEGMTGEGFELKSRLHSSELNNSAISYNNRFFLRIYRKVDPAINPDVEISHYLWGQAKFQYVPEYVGSIKWQLGKDTIVIGMMQALVENHGDGYSFMLERINNYTERILARNREELLQYPKLGSLAEPVSYEELPEELQVLLGNTGPVQIQHIGMRTAEMHKALAQGQHLKEFAPEEFSLHYQRSLFSSMQSLVREAYQTKSKNLEMLPNAVKDHARKLIERKEEVLDKLKRIYNKKLDVQKIRIHGNYHLGQVLFTGKDIAINDFGGDPTRSYSERRLKRSPLRDVAMMIRSLNYVAYDGFLRTNQVQQEDIEGLLPFAELWSHYMSSFFLRAYIDTVADTAFIPKDRSELQMMLETYLLEKAIFDLNVELNTRPAWAIVPLGVIDRIL
ncbi:maltose alpha-D-glucosyltransferase [Aridibaculum aurantiacum]|uniref:maltose alpha-D-glucosyltransferase n=1 Tax=Aridibaculum aurantiacum TaxID=2810307 RepID=UPI001A96957C|nr:maltose alpha-D-glucosyltransferase [Aridibaculum aurantiacum]